MNADFQLKLADYSIAVPSFAGITIADEVLVNVQTSAPLAAVVVGGK